MDWWIHSLFSGEMQTFVTYHEDNLINLSDIPDGTPVVTIRIYILTASTLCSFILAICFEISVNFLFKFKHTITKQPISFKYFTYIYVITFIIFRIFAIFLYVANYIPDERAFRVFVNSIICHTFMFLALMATEKYKYISANLLLKIKFRKQNIILP